MKKGRITKIQFWTGIIVVILALTDIVYISLNPFSMGFSINGIECSVLLLGILAIILSKK